MVFCPSANPSTNQKLTKSLTKSVETGTPYKNVPPKRGGTLTYYQLFCNEHATTQRRSTGRGNLCLARLCEAVSERERFPALRSVVGEDRLHAREASGGGGAHKCQDENHERARDVCQHTHCTAFKQPALKVRGDVAPNTPQQDAHTDDTRDIEQ